MCALFFLCVAHAGNLNAQNSDPNSPTLDTKTMWEKLSDTAATIAAECISCHREAPPLNLSKELDQLIKSIIEESAQNEAIQNAKKEALLNYYKKNLEEHDTLLGCISKKGAYKKCKKNDDPEQANGFARYQCTFKQNLPKNGTKNEIGAAVSAEEHFAVDSLARTLVGEMRHCAGEFKPAYVEVVARTILNRAIECNGKKCGYLSLDTKPPMNLNESLVRVISKKGQYDNWRVVDDTNLDATLCPGPGKKNKDGENSSASKIESGHQNEILKIATDVVFNTENFKIKTGSVGEKSFSFKSLQNIVRRKKDKSGNFVPITQKEAEKEAFTNTRLKTGITIERKTEDGTVVKEKVNYYDCLAVYEEIEKPKK